MRNSVWLKLRALIVDWIFPLKIAEALRRANDSRLRSHRKHEESNPLEPYLGEEWRLLREALEGANTYLEYGCGLSTEFVSKSYSCQVKSVETSAEWVTWVQGKVGDDAQLIHVDLGPIQAWGRPLTYQFRKNFIRYFEIGFDDGFSPDVVLVDGRFRVACFLTTLLFTRSGTRIVFDDYPSRPHFNVVEEVLSPQVINSRQALFVVPDSINYSRVRELRDEFTNVMD